MQMRLAQVVTDLRKTFVVAAVAMALGACAYADPNTEYADGTAKSNRVGAGNAYTDRGSIFGPGGVSFLLALIHI